MSGVAAGCIFIPQADVSVLFVLVMLLYTAADFWFKGCF
jgi:hypothetical protein